MSTSDLPTLSYLDVKGELSSSCRAEIPDDFLVRGYKISLQTRLVDERMITLQRQGTITFAMSSLGEEVCIVASAAALNLADWLYPQYRETGAIFWRGFSIVDYVHHMFGNAKDLILGRQMPNHFGSRALNVVTVSSPIGTKIPHAAGCAYAMKLQNERAVALCYFGEGATSEGDFHVGLNFASVRKAPVIFFCRNNGYAISTPCVRQFASEGVAPKAQGYGMPAIRVDGNDFFAVYEAVSKAKKDALEGLGPTLIEAMTYRMGAHSTSDDPSLYRSEQEVSAWREKDPLARLRAYLEKRGLWNENLQKDWTEQVNQKITQAIEEAKSTPPPSLHSLIENVYFEVPRSLEEELQKAQQELNPCPK